ncbi:hypothetical protein [Azorhizobium sp. AG788]|uniref:hypothetical protein n=1 Tax=Azorhizobium sp. AG788 TaxID=2183897 RepID=UPI003138E0E5
MSGAAPERKTTDADEFATYVASLAGELSRLARGHGFPTLAYLLDMARLEARAAVPKPQGRSDRAIRADAIQE